ncbi:MAG: hypothetical protein EU550_01595, partial [Promethearchaeota archaeon]
ERNINPKLTFLMYTIIGTIIIILIFTNIFPECYIEGYGLTPFKIISEYLIIAILSLSIILLHRKREKFDKNVFILIVVSNFLMILSEIFFTLYIDVFGFFNFIGHLLKILEFYLIYKAIIQIGLRFPFRSLLREIKQNEQILRESYERIDFYKDLFAHDISNIIQILDLSIGLFQEKMEKKENLLQDKEDKKILTNIQSQIKRGVNLIENVRKLTEIETNSRELFEIDIKDHLEKSIEYIEEAFERKGIDISKEYKTNDLIVKANELLQEVFQNILVNSVLHNENENIKIQIEIKDCPNNIEKCLRIEFKDNGIGVADGKKEIIFKEGFKEQKNTNGMGLGLSLVVKILNLFDGRIWVEDRVKGDYKKGSNFIIELPKL